MTYPEHDKLLRVADDSHTIREVGAETGYQLGVIDLGGAKPEAFSVSASAFPIGFIAKPSPPMSSQPRGDDYRAP